MSFTPVDFNYVRKAIQQLKNGKAPGPDKIPIMLTKDVTDLISEQLTMMSWRVAKVNLYFQIRI